MRGCAGGERSVLGRLNPRLSLPRLTPHAGALRGRAVIEACRASPRSERARASVEGAPMSLSNRRDVAEHQNRGRDALRCVGLAASRKVGR
jgi:hypothetical protein